MIRQAVSEDIRQLAELEQLCFSESWSERILETGLSCPYDTYLVAARGVRVLGYGVMRTLAGESEIQRIAVRPDCQRQGYARELLGYMVELSRNKQSGAVILEVRSSNEAAINLYKTNGFQVEGLRRQYYRNPTEDAVLMRLSLL